jgi:predicted nucleotidyltransferase
MTINTTPKEMAAGGFHTTTATTTNDTNFPTTTCSDKAFSTLRAAFALRGHTLHRTDPADGPVTYWAERWGLVRYLPTIDTARQFLEQIGGRL